MGGIWSTLLAVDQALFVVINHTFQTKVLDYVMPFITSIGNFRFPLILAGTLLFIWGGKREREVLIWSLLLLGLSDVISSHLLKNFFDRPRPCNTFDSVRLLAGCTSSFSFPSSHAVNITAQGVLFSIFYPRLRIPLYCLAFLVAYSRVYVGVHYPVDALGGMLTGFLLPYSLLGIRKVLQRVMTKQSWSWWKKNPSRSPLFPKRERGCKEEEIWVRES